MDTISTTRRYWMTATIRSSAPSSRLIEVTPAAPPALRLSEPVIALTGVHRPISRPATMLKARVPTITAATGSQSSRRLIRVLNSSRPPSTTPITACAAVFTEFGRMVGFLVVSATSIPVTRPPNNAGDGTSRTANRAVTAAVAITMTVQRAASRQPWRP